MYLYTLCVVRWLCGGGVIYCRIPWVSLSECESIPDDNYKKQSGDGDFEWNGESEYPHSYISIGQSSQESINN